MPKKARKKDTSALDAAAANAHILGAGEIVHQPVTETLETNFMPYAMSVILSRAIPEIDGFKPSQRKILYTMHRMGLHSGPRSKSANIVGRTMQLNPHGDAAIYETMVLLSRGHERLLHAYVDSKGNFGKRYSRDMQWAASRYTEARLEKIAAELFRDIDKNTVDFVDNYDATMKEPTLLPVRFPSVLVNLNNGIAVGMTSSICSFNLAELCETTIALAQNKDHDIIETLPAPDFTGGGQILYSRAMFEEIYRTGRGSFRLRAKYTYDKAHNCIDIYEIPSTTTAEAIIDKVVDRVKAGVIKEISDIRDETDKSGLKITIDLKRGIDAEKIMQRLFKLTSLEDSFSCNFNVLVNGSPRVLGVRELLLEWIAFRTDCIRRRVQFDLTKAQERLHLLQGLAKILLDIDKAIKVIRETEEESEVVPNLMIAFGIDQLQADYVAEIRLRHLNRAYILKRTADIDQLKQDIEDMLGILGSERKVRTIMVNELKEIAKAHALPRRSELIYAEELPEASNEVEIEDYPCTLFFTQQGYFKKITPASLRMNDQQKCKDGDDVAQAIETSNAAELLFFTNKCQVYKTAAHEFDDAKASVLGDYIPAKLGMDEDETVVRMAVTRDYSGYMLFAFEGGKVAKVELSAYATKTNRRKLIKAYSDKSPLVGMLQLAEDGDCLVRSSAGRVLLFHTGAIAPKTTKDTQGVAVMTLKKNAYVAELEAYADGMFVKPARYRTKNLPAAGVLPTPEDKGEVQLGLEV
ncbi:MAG: DNA topoisomerase (ATP-hydrolyzing) subunit A [Oscillospiraceae bacterium]|nr:DNA topoisomerase (ATP-hydrolyzing) subunit A [Oscillospiraceae bacterium]